MKVLNDLYLAMKENDQESTVLDLQAEWPVSLDMIFASLPIPDDIYNKDPYSHKEFGEYVLEEYIFPILRNGELKCRMPICRLIDEKNKKYKETDALFSHKMDIEEFIKVFRQEWDLDYVVFEIATEFGIPSIVWKDENKITVKSLLRKIFPKKK